MMIWLALSEVSWVMSVRFCDLMIRWQPLFKFRVCVVDDCLGAARSCHVEGTALASSARLLLRSFNAQHYLMTSTMIDEAETSGWFCSTSGSAAPTPDSDWLKGTMKCGGSGVSYII